MNNKVWLKPKNENIHKGETLICSPGQHKNHKLYIFRINIFRINIPTFDIKLNLFRDIVCKLGDNFSSLHQYKLGFKCQCLI